MEVPERGWAYCPFRHECKEDREIAKEDRELAIKYRQARRAYESFDELIEAIIKMGHKPNLTVIKGAADDTNDANR